MARFLLSAASLLTLVTSQFVTPPDDLIEKTGYAGISVRYKEVPAGICELDPSVKSYAGYADVGEDEHLFFWFFEAREVDPNEADLTVWINGGPGSSSMIGLWQENGPCRMNSPGKVSSNEYSWSRTSNMIFVDEPVTVGFSYSIPASTFTAGNGDIITVPEGKCPSYAGGRCSTQSMYNPVYTANATNQAAPNMWKLLQGFMGAFPQYSREGFHFTTESYGGHYAPVFNTYFLEQNKALPSGAKAINLESVAIGNGWYDPLIQYQAYYNFTVYPGNTYDYFPFTKGGEERMYNALYGEGNCVDQLKNCAATGRNDVCGMADNFCAIHVEELLDEYPDRDEYDIREKYPDPFPYEYYVDWLNTPTVQQAIGAYQNFTEFSQTTGNAFSYTGDDGREFMTIEDIQTLLASNVSVMIYAGDADYNCNWLGGQVIAHMVNAEGFSSAGYTNLSTSDGIVHGQVKQAGAFSFVRVYYSGHEVPFYQPLASFEMWDRLRQNKDIATGKVSVSPSYKTSGTQQSTFREGPGTVQHKVLPTDSTYNTTTNAPNPPTSRMALKARRFRETRMGRKMRR